MDSINIVLLISVQIQIPGFFYMWKTGSKSEWSKNVCTKGNKETESVNITQPFQSSFQRTS